MKYFIYLLSIILVLLSCNDQPAEPNKEDSGFVKLNFLSDNMLLNGFFINENTGWIVSVNSIFHTTDGGNSWEEFSIPANFLYYKAKIYFTDEKIGWLAKQYKPLYKTIDSGRTWTAIPDETVSCTDINDLYFENQNTGFLISSPNDEVAYIYKTTDGGNSWNSFRIFAGVEYHSIILTSIDFLNEKKGFITCCEYNNNLSSGFLLVTNDGGVNWSRKEIINNYVTSNLKFVNETTGWMIFESKLLKTTDGGLNWLIQNPLKNSKIKDMEFVDENNGWIAHNPLTSNNPCCDSYELQKTTDGGETWHYICSMPNSQDNIHGQYYTNDLFFINNLTGWIISQKGHIYKTTNGGNIVK